VVVGVKGLDYYIPWDENLVDQPLDILFALEQVAANPLEGLEGMIEAGRAGTMGYSFDGYNSLAMSGARLDPDFYLSQCEGAASIQPALSEFWIDYYCSPAENWVEFSAHAGEELTSSTDGLWQPMTDERIRAVMPMGPEGTWLFGERGLAAVDRPTLILCGTEDVDADYQRETVYIYEHLGTPDKILISFIGEEHGMVESDEPQAKMKHFATAFFGFYLQGREDYARYFSEDFVNRQENLAWGVYTEE
jgi:predicted dienelactone hydrolase